MGLFHPFSAHEMRFQYALTQKKRGPHTGSPRFFRIDATSS